MTAVADTTNRLDELLALPAERRAALLSAVADPSAELLRFGDDAERLALQDVNKSLSAAEMLVALADEAGAAIARARSRRALAHACAYAGRHEEALQHADEGRQIAEAADERIEAARCLLIALHPLASLGRYEEAIACGETARATLMRAGEPKLAARADFNLGGIHQKMDNPARALLHFDRAAPLFVDDAVITGYLHSNRGEALLLLHEFDAAEEAFRTALQSCAQAGMSVAAAIAEGNLADLAARRGSLSRALFHFEQSRRRLETDGAESHLVRLLAEQAEALEALGLFQDAHDGYWAILPQLDQLGLASEAARARVGLGRACMRLGKIADADAALREGEIELRRLGQSHARARVDVLRAELALAQNQADAARSLLSRAAPELSDRPLDVALVAHHRARLALLEGAWDEAEAALTEAIRIAQQLDLAPLLSDLFALRAKVSRSRGNVAEAIEHGRRAVSQIERVRGSLQADRFRAAFLGNRLDAYEDLALSLLDGASDKTTAEAFEVIEKAKSRSLLEAVRGAVESDGVAIADDMGLRSSAGRLRAELNALYSQLAEQGLRGGSDFGGYREGIRIRERELTAIEARLSSGSGVENLFARPATLADAIAALPADAALIEYFVANDELLAIVASTKGVNVIRGLTNAESLRGMAERVRFQLNRAARPGAAVGARADRLIEDLRRELSALYQAVLAPLTPSIGDARLLIIAPHGPLHLMPFHALWDGERYALERFRVLTTPSASVFSAARSTQDTGTNGALVVGVADENAPRIEIEARQLADQFGGTALIDDEATVDTTRGAMRKARWIHLACHGQFSSQHPMASGLRLFDRWLTLRDICELRLDADLVTLSACNSGRNTVQAGDELTGLLRSFLAAGARSVLASLWPAHDASTTELMRDFYSTWADAGRREGGKVEALRQAQLRAMQRTPHPIFWAPFVLVGRP